MTRVYLIGTGVKRFGKYENMSVSSIGKESVLKALNDSGVSIDDMESVFCGSFAGGSLIGQRVLSEFAITGVPVINVENACASGSSAFNLAYNSIKSGATDISLAIGVDKLSDLGKGVLPTPKDDLETFYGATLPSHYAMQANRYLETYGIEKEVLSDVSIKNRYHAVVNPNAHFYQKSTLTKDDVLNSRKVADPFTLLQSSPKSDGAASAILCSENMLKKIKTKAVEVASSVVVTGKHTTGYWDMALPDEPSVEAINLAYNKAGITAEEVSVSEVHDAFSIAEILYSEACGFCDYGKGTELLLNKETYYDGKHPINVSGGLLSRGHAIGATGIAQIAEVYSQLMGTAGGYQVPNNPKIGLTHTTGGGISNFSSGSAVVNILSI